MVQYLSEFKLRRKNSLSLTKPLTKPQTSTTKSVNIKVVVRVRPITEKENERQIIEPVDDQTLIFDPTENVQPFFYHGLQQNSRKKNKKNLQFTFDKVFGFEATNEQIYENTTQHLIDSLMDGYNCSVFAYGATGAGKTYTMLGNNENPGIIYLTIAELFKKKRELSGERNFEIGITYLEVYNELVQNLLNPDRRPLQLMEDGKYGVIVAGLKICKIESADELFRLLEQGNNNRTQHPTDANAESSRSHAVFQVYIQMDIKLTNEVRGVKLSMIDLAGSECGAATDFIGARFVEGANINKSLLALGNCINCLADGRRHVPYRDSKLTRLLKDSLGGNCQTVMVANVSSSSFNYEDTYNTLRYATRVKKIKANMSKNVLNSVELYANQYIKIVEDLKQEVQLLKMQLIENRAEQESLELQNLLTEHKKIVENVFEIENSEQIIIWRRQLKEEADARLSFLSVDVPEIQENNCRLGHTIERFHHEENLFKSELCDMKKLKTELEIKINELVKKNSSLQQMVDVHYAQIAQIEYQHKAELAQKRIALLEVELKSRASLLVKMSELLQPCFLQLRGHGFATERMVKDYQGLMRHLQSLKNISWIDNNNVNDLEINSAIDTYSNDAVNNNSNSCLENAFKTLPIQQKICAKKIIPTNRIDFAYLNVVAGEIILSVILCTLLMFVKK